MVSTRVLSRLWEFSNKNAMSCLVPIIPYINEPMKLWQICLSVSFSRFCSKLISFIAMSMCEVLIGLQSCISNLSRILEINVDYDNSRVSLPRVTWIPRHQDKSPKSAITSCFTSPRRSHELQVKMSWTTYTAMIAMTDCPYHLVLVVRIDMDKISIESTSTLHSTLYRFVAQSCGVFQSINTFFETKNNFSILILL